VDRLGHGNFDEAAEFRMVAGTCRLRVDKRCRRESVVLADAGAAD
jgi:hypothetical protein